MHECLGVHGNDDYSELGGGSQNGDGQGTA